MARTPWAALVGVALGGAAMRCRFGGSLAGLDAGRRRGWLLCRLWRLDRGTASDGVCPCRLGETFWLGIGEVGAVYRHAGGGAPFDQRSGLAGTAGWHGHCHENVWVGSACRAGPYPLNRLNLREELSDGC